jgi:hypothetical protein
VAPSSPRVTHDPSHLSTTHLEEYPRLLSTCARLTESLVEPLRFSTSSLPSSSSLISVGDAAGPTPVELVFLEALAADAQVGAEFGPNPVKHFCKKQGRFSVPQPGMRRHPRARTAGPLLDPTHVGRMGISRAACVSTAAWLLSLYGLISLLTYLSFTVVTAKQFPSISLTFTREKQLRLPINTVCPSFSDATLFPRGATALGKGLPPLVTLSEVHFPVSSSSQMRVIKYTQSLANVEQVSLAVA